MKDENALLQIYMKSFKHICSSRINLSIVRFMKRVTSKLPLWMCFDYMNHEILPKISISIGFWAANRMVNSICWVSQGIQYHRSWCSTSQISSHFPLNLWPNSQMPKSIINAQNIWIDKTINSSELFVPCRKYFGERELSTILFYL